MVIIMENDLLRIEKLLLKYLSIISKEYSFSEAEIVINKIKEGKRIVKFNSTQSISFFVNDGILLLPKAAYDIFPSLKRIKNYGTKLNQHRNIEEYLDTNTTYYDYINHVIESGMSVYKYFEESLLHETMHICGSRGGTPLEEGINELKTRELAQKYNISIAAYGYPKEVEIAKKLQKIIGKEIMDELTFIPIAERFNFLASRVSIEIAKLYDLLSIEMVKRSKDYYCNIGQISDPYEKAKFYMNKLIRVIYIQC